MATVDEIRSQISAAQKTIEEKKQELIGARQEREDALERQRLRRELENLQREIEFEQSHIDVERFMRRGIDADAVGRYKPEIDGSGNKPSRREVPSLADRYQQHEEDSTRGGVVAKANYVWKISEFSWLTDALEHEQVDCSTTRSLKCGGSEFIFQYSPKGGDEGTLCIWHSSSDSGGISFRYKIFLKRQNGEFVQWGNTGRICIPAGEDGDAAEQMAFGPDVPTDGGARPQGVFGLTHDALLKSEWVENDTLTVRFELEVRLAMALDEVPEAPQVHVPAASLSADLFSLLETGLCSDCAILVDGETIRAHSAILCSRSEVFNLLFNGSMRESISKEVHIEDCSATTFKALLKYIYTDDFTAIEDYIEGIRLETRLDEKASNSESRLSGANRKPFLSFQSLLSVSHKYGLSRLQAWCEAKLCECITVDDVCSILCQAHLYQAEQLTNACLAFVKSNYAAVIVTDKFGKLATESPEVVIKINLCASGISETAALAALQACQRSSLKRKREE